MAYGAVLKFNFTGLQALIQHFLGDWRTFEGWCVSKGCDPLKENPRRMVSLMMYFVERNMDDEIRAKFRDSVYNPQLVRHLKVVQDADTTGKKFVPTPGTKKWQAPPGWTPPGWNEEKSYQSAKAFMSFQTNPK